MKTLEDWRLKIFILTMISSVLFISLCVIAMFFYSGGTEINPNTSGYSFFTNFFSDLGRTESPTGKTNIISQILFTMALIIINSTYIFFCSAMTFFFKEKRRDRLLSNLSRICGTFSGIFGIGITFLPINLFPEAHLFVTMIFSNSFLISLLPYIFLILYNHQYENRYSYVLIIYSIMLGIYLSLILIDFNWSSDVYLIVLATGQKITIFAGFFCCIILAFGAIKTYSNHYN